jgi:tripartite-type tricarboxylate transporter receptor subunit TctC
MKPQKLFLLLAAACALNTSVWAQNYPTQPIKLVVPFPPGGLIDNVARIISPKLSAALKQPVVIDNKPGQGGNIGADAVAKAAGDGYTLLLASPSVTISPNIYKSLPYKPADLAPIAFMGSVPNVLVANNDVKAKTTQELIDVLKRSPGRMNYASNGVGTSLHLSGELFKILTQSYVVHIPYRGSAAAMTGLQAGEVHYMFDNLPPALPQIKAGRVKALAVTTDVRSPALPDVPTLKELGLRQFDVAAWFGIMAPANTPERITKRLEAELEKLGKDPEVVAAFERQGISVKHKGQTALARHINDERNTWKTVVEYSKISAD